MAKKIIWSNQIIEDAKNVTDYLQNEWSITIAEKFIERLYHTIDLIKSFPEIGIASRINPSIRRILITQHNALYYMIRTDEIILLNIFDTRQNPDKDKNQ